MSQPPFKFKPTETVKLNKSNWSGQEVEMKVDRKNLAFDPYGQGDVFWLEFVPWKDADEETISILGRGRYKIRGDQWDADYCLGMVHLPSDFDRKRTTTHVRARAMVDPGIESAYERESDTNPDEDEILAAIEAAAKLVFNTV